MMRYLFLFAFICLLHGHISAQNLFDESHTSSFAGYLYKSSQFKLASEEYERLLFLNPSNDTVKLFLLKSYRKAGLIDKGIERTQELFPDINQAPTGIFDEFTYMLILDRQFNKVGQVVSSSPSLSTEKKDYISMNMLLLNKDWKDARKIYTKNNNDSLQSFVPYKPIIYESEHLRHRSAGAAMLFSAIVPGSGKFYTGDWRDGIVSFALIGICGYQAYRGFSSHAGVKSAYGWVYGGLGFGFYMGNLYGSFKSAKKFNHKYEDALVKKSGNLFMSNL